MSDVIAERFILHKSERRKAYRLATVTVDNHVIVPAGLDHRHARNAVNDWNRVLHLKGKFRLRTKSLLNGTLMIYASADPVKDAEPTKEKFLAYLRCMAKGQCFSMGPEYKQRYDEFKQYCAEFSEADRCSIVTIEDDPEKLIILRDG